MLTDMTEITLIRIICTCQACPAQWDAWDADGGYWYLRYRHSSGTAERQPGPDPNRWIRKPPEIWFETDRGRYDGWIELEEFCQLAGMILHPDAEITGN